jgi:hypothetical protein
MSLRAAASTMFLWGRGAEGGQNLERVDEPRGQYLNPAYLTVNLFIALSLGIALEVDTHLQ